MKVGKLVWKLTMFDQEAEALVSLKESVPGICVYNIVSVSSVKTADGGDVTVSIGAVDPPELTHKEKELLALGEKVEILGPRGLRISRAGWEQLAKEMGITIVREEKSGGTSVVVWAAV